MSRDSAMDRYITGNYGEDYFLIGQEDEMDDLEHYMTRVSELTAQLAAAEAARQATEARAAELAEAVTGLLDGLDANSEGYQEGISNEAWDVRVTTARTILAASPAATATADVLRAAEAWRDWNLGSEDPVRKPAQGLREAIDNWRAAREAPTGGKE